MNTPSISVIIICRNEEAQLRELLPELLLFPELELIVADGESSDQTRQLVESFGCRYIRTPCGRGRQLNAGAQVARGETLLFLHADCRLARGWKAELESALKNPEVVGGAFSLKLCGGRPWLDRYLSWTGTLNARNSQVFLGDHSIFVRRGVFEQIGGFPELKLMEDYHFSRELRKAGKLVQLRSASIASSRRFVRNGYLKTVVQMRLLRLYGRFGLSSPRLERWYLQGR
ncbi:MAG TPA: TIGR04283 family arsenosugar biosynthesis glycosyltransferase [Acidobacteriota bacterium]|jgi:rSAM/selenodomain-associated transferase 2